MYYCTFDIPEYRPNVELDLYFKDWNEIDIRMTKDWKLTYTSPELEFTLELLEGYITDGGSIWKIFWNIISPRGLGLIGFLAHDGLYDLKAVPRWVADLIMYRVHQYCKLNPILAWTIYRLVRIGGGGHWKLMTHYNSYYQCQDKARFTLHRATGKFAFLNNGTGPYL